MNKGHKQTDIILLFKFLILSFIFYLPKAPTVIAFDDTLSAQKKSSNYSFILPSNAHFEIKVLKKIPLLEVNSFLPDEAFYLNAYAPLAVFSPTSFILIKTSHFRTTSYPRGPPLHS